MGTPEKWEDDRERNVRISNLKWSENITFENFQGKKCPRWQEQN